MRTQRLWPLLALALAGCDEPAGQCGSLVWSESSGACQTCMEDRCCAALAACDVGTDCGDLAACVLACPAGDTACTSACGWPEAAGSGALDTLLTCFEDNCKRTDACGARVCDTKIVVADPACGECLSASCCDSWAPCAADAACAACLMQDPKPDACAADALYLSASACFVDACGTACAATICDSSLGTDSAACNVCLGRADAAGGCCELTLACKADPGCYGCITGANLFGCDDNASWQAFAACVDARCAAPCGG